MPFSHPEQEFLDRPLVAQLATLLPDGAPHLTAIWQRREGDTIRLVCEAGALKARNIARDPRVALTVIDADSPYHYLQVRGRAEVVADDALARDELRRLAGRYLGSLGDAFVAQLPDVGYVILVVHPERSALTVNL